MQLKNIFVVLISLGVLVSCNKSSNIDYNASVIGFNPDKAMCQYGWTIIYQGRIVKSDDQIIGSTIGFNPKFPVDVSIQVNEKGHMCNSMGHFDYISIDAIER